MTVSPRPNPGDATAASFTLEALSRRVGARLGPSRSQVVDQAMIDSFAGATGDHQWIHVDTERAAGGPFGGTIAHGYLTLSLIPVLLASLLAAPDDGVVINYGLDRVRFPSPVPVGTAVRLEATVVSVESVDRGGFQVVLKCIVGSAAQPKPACVASCILRWYAGAA